MTNAEKFKSVGERAKAFENYCNSQKGGCNECLLNKYAGDPCRFKWLELEYKEELKPCPFCGEEATTFKAEGRHYVSCVNDDCIAGVATQSFLSEEDAIAAWNRRV